jgi:hypothetical protein
MNEYLRRRSDKLVYSLAGLRLEEAMVDMEIYHEIGYKTNISASLVLNEVCPKKQKTGEELGNKIGYNVGKDDHKVGDSDEIELEARLVANEVGPEKLKTREGLCNEIVFEDNIMDIGLAVSTDMNIDHRVGNT